MLTKHLKAGFRFFFHFHKGTVNIAMHIVGFALCFYSLLILSWQWFLASIIIIEGGHVYNHIARIEPYDFRLNVTFWRIIIFALLVIGVYALGQFLPSFP